MLIEACVDTITDAITAESAGADRLELCSNLSEGGTTPSLGLIQAVIAQVRVPVVVMIRPRGGDFMYSEVEMDVMCRDIEAARLAGVQGVVTGVLDGQAMVDRISLGRLLNAASPLPVTFHRAFDQTQDLEEALATCIESGVSRILTSGGCTRAIDAVETLRQLRTLAGTDLTIVAGGGIRADNIREIVNQTGIEEIHLGPRRRIASQMQVQSGTAQISSSATHQWDWQGLDSDALATAIQVVRRG